MQSCATCRYRSALPGGRIDCLNTAAAPRTLTYAGSGAHPVNFDPAIVDGCDDWELADELYAELFSEPAEAAA